MVELIIFLLMGAVVLAGGLTVVMARNPIYSAMGMLATLFSVGVLYVVQLAHFVAAVQVIVYAGAVMTLFLFVIMLIGVDKDEDLNEKLPFQRQLAMGLAVSVLGVAGTLLILGRFVWTPGAPPVVVTRNGTIQALADELFGDWVLPFEVTALLLTIAAAGAIALAFRTRPTPREEAE